MKRILKLSLALAFSIISLGAFAQVDATHSVGSIHTFKVNVDDTGHTGNAYTWAVYLKNSDGTDGDATDMYAFIETTDAGAALKTAQIQWLSDGDFFVELSETNATGGCSTLRRVNILVTSGAIDLLVVASDNGGSTLKDGALTDCNDMSGEIIANGSGFGTSVRYFTVSMATDGQAWTTGAWGFEFSTLAGATVSTTTGGVTIGGTAISIPAGESIVTFKVDVANTPGPSTANDITLGFVASNAYITTGAGNTNETANLGNNTPDEFVITASPETTVITIQ